MVCPIPQGDHKKKIEITGQKYNAPLLHRAAITIKATRQQHRPWMMSSIWRPARVQRSGCLCACRSSCLMTEGRRPILLLLLLVAGLLVCGVAAVELMLHYFRV